MSDGHASPRPQVHVAVGYPVQELEAPWTPHVAYHQPGEMRVQHMKTFIVLVFMLASVQTSLQLLCAIYLQQVNQQVQASVAALNHSVLLID
jgi:hypothetical protein